MDRNNHGMLRKSIDIFDDLYYLSDKKLIPLIDQAYFSYCNLQNELNKNKFSLEGLDGLRTFFKKSLRQMIHHYFVEKSELLRLDLFNQTKYLNLVEWDKILASLPIFLQVIGFFKFDSSFPVSCKIDKNGIELAGVIKMNQGIESKRQEIYAHFRRLLKMNIVLTFDLDDRVNQGLPTLRLFLDITHCSDLVYRIDYYDKYKCNVGFSNLFARYKLPCEKIDCLSDHLCLEITEDLKLYRYDRIPDKFAKEIENFEIIHFSFLFRPVSIIIPNRGKLVPINGSYRLGDTGSGKSTMVKQEVYSNTSANLWYIDFFSLIFD